MKKIVFFTLATFALLAVASCEKNLDIPQKGVTAYETFYKTDEDCEAALTAAYAQFAENVVSQNGSSIYTHYKACLNNCGDDMYAAGSNFGDNDFMAALNEFRYDTGNAPIEHLYQRLFMANYACNLVIDNFKDGLPEGGPTATTKRAVAEARTIRAYIYFLLTALWDTPPFIDHVITDGLPYNSDKDPENPMSHEDLLKWVAAECEAAIPDLDERKSTSDKDATVKMTKGFAWAVEGKALLFAKDYAGAKTALKKVIDSGKYALVPGEKYWENFHVEGDCNEEKIFEANIEYNSGIGAWGGMIQRSTWMEANIWNWRSDHFVAGAAPQSKYTGGVDGWGGLGVPQWFGDEFFENDGHSKRFDATLMHIDDAVYQTSGVAGMSYQDEKLQKMSADELKNSKEVGIKDVTQGLYGQSFWLPFKNVMRRNDVMKPDGSGLANGDNNRYNNIRVMRYAEVLLNYAEACLQTGDAAEAKKYVNMIQERAGSKTISDVVDMEVLKKEKSYELWYEGCRFFDVLRWKDQKGLENLKNAGQKVPHLFDKLFRTPKPDEQVVWEHGSESNSRFYNVYTHEGKDAGFEVGFKAGKHEFFPIPQTILDKNPKMHQNKAWEGK